jgi:hypothetical protein
MIPSEQFELWSAEKVAAQAAVKQAANGIHYAFWGENRITEQNLQRLVEVVPKTMAAALERRTYYFVPLVIGGDETVIAPGYTVELGDRAVCHRNAPFGAMEAVFLSTRMTDDSFGLSFEFFINVAHNFIEAVGVPESFSTLAWSQAEAQVSGETSQDAWETRRAAMDSRNSQKQADEKACTAFYEAAFSDSLAIYMLAMAQDFDYHDLREHEYPLLATSALTARLRHIASLFPANSGYEFQILYRRKG